MNTPHEQSNISTALLHLQDLIRTSISAVQPEDSAEDYVEVLRFVASELGALRASLHELVPA